MIGVMEGFFVIAVIIAVGWVLGRMNVLGENAQGVLSRIVFFVATPALMLDTLQKANLGQIFNANLVVQSATAALTFLLYVLVAKLWWKPAIPEMVLGGMSTSYVNAGNLGIPLSVYVFGSATYVAPVMLFQIALYAPIMMAILDSVTGTRRSGWRRVVVPLTNPMIIASAIGIVLSVTDVTLPSVVLQPIELLANMSVPGALLAFGISLSSMSSLKGTEGRHDVTVIVVMKLVVQPILAYLMCAFVFQLSGMELFSCVAIAALPTAQNMITYATRYERGRFIARNSILFTTLLSIPALLLITFLLSPGG